MEYASCFVRQGGSLLSEVQRHGVTPAELILLRHIHTDQGVVKIEITGKNRRSNASELNRLSERFEKLTDQNDVLILGKLFPGFNPAFPQTFAEIGIEGKVPDEFDEDILEREKQIETELKEEIAQEAKERLEAEKAAIDALYNRTPLQKRRALLKPHRFVRDPDAKATPEAAAMADGQIPIPDEEGDLVEA